MHQVMMTKSLEYCEHGNCPCLTATEVTDILTEAVRNITDKNDGITSTASINDSLIKIQVLPAFTRFIDKCSETNATWRFWSQFVFKDGLA